MKIFKYQLDTVDLQFLSLPANAKILDIQIQDKVPCLWAIVDPQAPAESVSIRMFGTGWDVSKNINMEYISTVQQGCFVWHYFKELSS